MYSIGENPWIHNSKQSQALLHGHVPRAGKVCKSMSEHIIALLMVRAYFLKRLKDPIMALLGQGMAPERIALSLACGVTLGLFPILGLTTLLCLAVTLLFRLNTTAAVLANWAVYPLQVVLIAPFFMAGGYLFGTGSILHAAPRITPLTASGLIHGAGLIAGGSLHAVLAWALAAPFATAVLYFSLLPVLRKLPHGRRAS